MAFKADDIIDVLPMDNVTEELAPILVSQTMEVHEAIPARSRVNPVALGWVALLEGVKRRHAQAKRPNAATGPTTFTFCAPTDQSFFVMGVMIEFSGNELTPSSPFDITVTVANNGATVASNTLRGDIKDIRAGKDGQRNMALVMFSAPIISYGIPTVAGAVATSTTAVQESCITGFNLTHADTELSDIPKCDTITVAIASINAAYTVNCQLLTPGNNNFDALVSGLFKHEMVGATFSIADFFAETFK